MNETAKKDKNKNSGKKADANFNESMAEQKINWIGKLEPNSEEALTMFEALKKDEIANQAQLRLARISGTVWPSNVVPAEIVRRPSAGGLRIFWAKSLVIPAIYTKFKLKFVSHKLEFCIYGWNYQ